MVAQWIPAFAGMTVVLFLSLSAHAQTPLDPMRGLIWGLPLEAVKNFETAAYIGEEEGVVVYSTVIRPDPAKRPFQVMIEYTFAQDRLQRMRYDIPVSRGDPSEALDDVMTWQLWFDAVFNQTSAPRFSFRNPNVRSDPQRWGWAIYRGDGDVRIDWRDSATQAALRLSGRDYTPRFSVTLAPVNSRANP